MMLTTVQKWGNSQGLRLARSVLEEARIAVGDEVDVAVKDGLILVTPAKRLRGKHRIEDLVSRIPDEYKPQEADWGQPAGMEAW